MKPLTPPRYAPIKHLDISSRWFPAGASFGLYKHGSAIAPNVTSILSSFFPFDKAAWIRAEPDIDHDAVSRESAVRGTAVHSAMEAWLTGASHNLAPQYMLWFAPLQELVCKANCTLAVELPVFCVLPGIGSYAGSADALMIVNSSVVLVDYKTKRENKRVHERYLLKQKLQMAAYATAIDMNYAEQLPSHVDRASLLFAHPDPGRKPTVVKIYQPELSALKLKWAEMLGQWHAANKRQLMELTA